MLLPFAVLFSVSATNFIASGEHFVPHRSVFHLNSEMIIFKHFTKSYESTERYYQLKINDINNLQTSAFDPLMETKFVVHGWLSDASNGWIQDMVDAYLKRREDYNVIVVLWKGAYQPNDVKSQEYTKQVGDYLALFIRYLEAEAGLSLNNVHIIGHSLGAHIAGLAGDNLGAEVYRITGLDPTNMDYNMTELNSYSAYELKETSAQFVDAIRTDETFNWNKQYGHVEFYANNGESQPGCSDENLDDVRICGFMSHDYYVESIRCPAAFPASKCPDDRSTSRYKGEMKYGRYAAENCRGTIEYMGEATSRFARGIFALETNDQSPFGRGGCA